MSDFWTKKMKTYFKRIDFDHDGKITRADFEGMAKRFIDTGKLKGAKADDLKSTLTAVWDKYLSNVQGGNSISEAAFIDSMKKLLKDPSMKSTVEGPLPLFFHAVDANDDKFISGDEYKQFFQILGLDPKLADAAFKAIDTNKDGLLSLEEFTTAGVDFFFSTDEKSVTSLFWGPLV